MGREGIDEIRIADRVYGEMVVDEPVLNALLVSRPVLRLQGVLQHGISGLVGVTRATTRYEHSVGVMLLVRRLGGTLEAQVAALLHDVSHTAFSHVIDYVFSGHDTQGYHEEVKEEYLQNSDLPTVLERFGYDWRTFLHEERFPLLEQPAPDLCADRLDYFLRDAFDLGLAELSRVRGAVEHLVVLDGRIGVTDLETARWMAETYLQADEASWANFREVGLYELTARAIRRGLEIGALRESDFWTTDRDLWARLQGIDDPQLQAELSLVSADTIFHRDAEAPDFWVSTKLRTIDPDVRVNGRFMKLSELDAGYARRRRDYLESKAGKWPVRVKR